MPLPPGCMEAGVSGTGAAHAVLGARLVIERGLDAGSTGAIAQADIRQYYDHIDPVLCGQWLLDHGCCAALAGAAVRHQLMPSVEVAALGSRVEVGDRARGALTGSRVAGSLGRIAVRDVMIWVHERSAHRAFGPSDASVLMSTYVDNIMVAGRDSSSAAALLRVVETRLRERWALSLPEASMEVLAPRGAPTAADGIANVESMKFLGHILSADGRLTQCWGRAQGAVRAALWKHIRAARRSRLTAAAKLRIVDQFVWPILAYRVTAWPPTEALYASIDSLQRWCVAQALTVVRFPGEAVQQYFLRRGRVAGGEAKKAGTWSSRAAALVLNFRDRVVAEAPAKSWPARLLPWRGSAWVRERRILLGSDRVFAGRLGTRLPGGRPAPRWDEMCEMLLRSRGRHPR